MKIVIAAAVAAATDRHRNNHVWYKLKLSCKVYKSVYNIEHYCQRDCVTTVSNNVIFVVNSFI